MSREGGEPDKAISKEDIINRSASNVKLDYFQGFQKTWKRKDRRNPDR